MKNRRLSWGAAATFLFPMLLVAGPDAQDVREASRVAALASELVAVSGGEAEAVGGMEDVLKPLDPARREAVQRVIVKGDLRARLAGLYRNLFTPSEMEALIAFYRTSAGQKLRDRGRELMSASRGIGQEFAKEKVTLAAAPPPGAKASDASAADELSKIRQTMSELRTLAVIVEAWAVDHNDAYPKAAGVPELAALVEPIYIRAGRTPLKDAWGTPFRYVCDGKSYRFVSAGADRTFESGSTNLGAAPAGETNSPARDLIFSDGRFIQYPKTDPK